MATTVKIFLLLLLSVFSCVAQGDVEDLMLLRPPVAVAGGSPSSLVTNLVAYWRMDEQSGTRYDAASTNHLTDNNTVGYVASLITNASLFASNNSEYLSIPDNDALSLLGGSFTIAFQAKLFITNVDSQYIVTKSGAAGNREWYIRPNNLGGITWLYYTNGTGSRQIQNTSVIETNDWQRYVAIVNEAGGAMYAVLNLSEFKTNTANYAAGGTSTADLRIAALSGSSGFLDGLVDEFAIWNRALSWVEVTNLINNWSNAVSYPWTGLP